MFRDGVGFRVGDRAWIRCRVRARCGFDFIYSSLSVL